MNPKQVKTISYNNFVSVSCTWVDGDADARECKCSALRRARFWRVRISARRKVRTLRAKLAAAKSKAPPIGF